MVTNCALLHNAATLDRQYVTNPVLLLAFAIKAKEDSATLSVITSRPCPVSSMPRGPSTLGRVPILG
jgi:hypothetical protein